MDNRKWKLLIVLLGLGMLVLAGMVRSAYPAEIAWMPEGFSSPVLAFEFIQTNEEVLKLFGSDIQKRDESVAAMNHGHKVDIFFLLFYSLFIITLAGYYLRRTGAKWLYIVIFLSVIAGICDVLENVQLAEIDNNLESKEFGESLRYLFLFTWLKWGSLALALSGMALYNIKKSWFGKIFAVISFSTVILGVIAFLNRSIMTTYFTQGISVQFLCLFILAVMMVAVSKQKSVNSNR